MLFHSFFSLSSSYFFPLCNLSSIWHIHHCIYHIYYFKAPLLRHVQCVHGLVVCVTRTAVGESKIGRGMVNSQENGIICSPESHPNCFDNGQEILREGSENQEEEVLMDAQVSDSLERQRNATNSNHHLNRNGRDKDMEMALEHQAQLIGQYAAEEKAQREWEEKFRENNNSTPVCFISIFDLIDIHMLSVLHDSYHILSDADVEDCQMEL